MKRHILIGLAATMLLAGGLPANGLPVEKVGLLGEPITLCDPRNRSTEAESRKCDSAIKRWQQAEDSAASPSLHVAQPEPQPDASSDRISRQWAELMVKRRAEQLAEQEALNRMWREQCAHYNLPCDQPPWEKEKQREEAMIAQYKSLPLEEYFMSVGMPAEPDADERYFISNRQVNEFIVRQWCTPHGILCDVTLSENTPQPGATTEYWCLEQLRWRRGSGDSGCETQKTKYSAHLDSPLLRLLELTTLAVDEWRRRDDRDIFTKWWNEKRQQLALAVQNSCNDKLNQKLDALQRAQDRQSDFLNDQFTYQWMWNSLSLPPWNLSR